MIEGIAKSPSRTLLAWCGAAIAGAAVHAALEFRWMSVYGVMVAMAVGAAVAIIGLALPRRTRLVAIALGLALLSAAHYDAVLGARLAAVAGAPTVTTPFTGRVAASPEERTTNTVVRVADLHVMGGAAVPGVAQLTLPTQIPAPAYDAEIAWTCKPRKADLSAGGYDAYLFARGITWTCYVRVLGTLAHPRPSFGTTVAHVRASIIAAARKAFPEPKASLALGLLIGADDGLPASVKAEFNDTGTSHILAVSGYNVVQLVRLLVLMLGLLRVRRRAAAGSAAVGIMAFAFLVGGDASVVRAAIMGCVMVLASIYERPYSGTVALPLAGALMLLAEPLMLRHDVGFALSFAAVIGLHAFGPYLERPLRRVIPVPSLARLAAETIAATIATVPVILVVFGRQPLLGLFANLVILPLIPPAMLLSALTMVAGALWSPLAVPFAFTASLFLSPVLAAAGFFAGASNIAVVADPGPVGVALLCVAQLALWLLLRRRARRRREALAYAPI